MMAGTSLPYATGEAKKTPRVNTDINSNGTRLIKERLKCSNASHYKSTDEKPGLMAAVEERARGDKGFILWTT